ncbi:alpha/beta hydrolase family protein [Pedobacter sp. P26]|uniref:alpha/beta hydrolase family protein n=1 Tax=Pedobacter sp. P26 TaxID=3423956 RepID=UPI003D678170
MSWETAKGTKLQGILYKPENLDLSKKYPVIITYYENRSDAIYDFLKPKLMHTVDIDIPRAVSRGYLVFVPDMKYRVGEVLKSALECLESGTDEICKRTYVDRERIGLSGHSHGGFETAYFVTQSNRFKAATIGAPVTNLVSWYNDWSPKNHQVRDQGTPQGVIEWRQTRMVRSMFERPEWYIQNSPVFYVDKVTTPVLIVHNREDVNVPFSQGAEFFLALSRLGKPAWLLQYYNEQHAIGNYKNQVDLTIRTEQFFDHYLKSAPLPVWMIDGIPFKDRNYKDGLKLDTLKREVGSSPLVNGTEQKLIEEYSKVPLHEKLKRLKD